MFRLAALIYIMAATVIAGMGVTAVLATPALSDTSDKWIIGAVLFGMVVAVPISYMVAKAVDQQIKKI